MFLFEFIIKISIKKNGVIVQVMTRTLVIMRVREICIMSPIQFVACRTRIGMWYASGVHLQCEMRLFDRSSVKTYLFFLGSSPHGCANMSIHSCFHERMNVHEQIIFLSQMMNDSSIMNNNELTQFDERNS